MSHRFMFVCGWLTFSILLFESRTTTLSQESIQVTTESIARLSESLKASDEAIQSQLSKYIQRRRQQYNQASSAAWRDMNSRDEWEAFRDSTLGKLAASLGHPKLRPAKLNSQITRQTELAEADLTIENVLYESRPGVWVSANLYRPRKHVTSAPGIIISHAHHTPKEHGELQDMGMTWARAGCYVLVPDHFGHGERRQHPFVSAEDYAGSFRVSRQDYYFRYDLGIKLHLLGESLMGWLSWDLSRGVDYLLQLPGIDPQRIILLGAVAGGGDPCAVTAALDKRIAAAVPFNFGGPQPETRYPLPVDVETSFNYAGGGSWESTRNLSSSAVDGFLPWVIVGGIAPRKLIYAHEFNWDQARDPVWKRLGAIYRWYASDSSLSYTHGRGELRGQPPEATHCTHIGAFHRQRMHAAFRSWFDIPVAPEDEYSSRVPAQTLRCFPASADNSAPNATVHFRALAESRVAIARADIHSGTHEERRKKLQTAWSRLLGQLNTVEDRTLNAELSKHVRSYEKLRIEQVAIESDREIRVPMTYLRPAQWKTSRIPTVVITSQLAPSQMLDANAQQYAHLTANGVAVCIVQVRGTGAGQIGTSRGRSSSSTSVSSSLLMLGDPLIAGQLRDLRAALRWLRSRSDVDSHRLMLWGDSRSKNATEKQLHTQPRDDDSALPPSNEPGPALLALLAALYEDGISSVCISGGLASFVDAMDPQQIRFPHDCLVPGFFSAGDIEDLVTDAARRLPVRLELPVNGLNRPLESAELKDYKAKIERLSSSATQLVVSTESAAHQWFAMSASQ